MKSILNKNWANRPSEYCAVRGGKIYPINVCCLVSFTDQSCTYTGKYPAKKMGSCTLFYSKVQSQIWAWIFLCWFIRKERKPRWEWRRGGNRKVQGNRTQCWRALLCHLSEEEVVLGPSNWVQTLGEGIELSQQQMQLAILATSGPRYLSSYCPVLRPKDADY